MYRINYTEKMVCLIPAWNIAMERELHDDIHRHVRKALESALLAELKKQGIKSIRAGINAGMMDILKTRQGQ